MNREVSLVERLLLLDRAGAKQEERLVHSNSEAGKTEIIEQPQDAHSSHL